MKSEEEDVAKDFHSGTPLREHSHSQKLTPSGPKSIFSENPLDTFCRVMILR